MQATSPAAAPPPSRYRLLIADDHPIVRNALRQLLETRGCFDIVAEAEDGVDALAKIAEFDPDVVLLDITMPRLNGIEVAKQVTRSGGRTRIITISMLEEEHHVRAALAAGAVGFVPKAATPEDFLTAVQTIAKGGHYVHNRVVRALMPEIEGRADGTVLSDRETKVLRLTALGYTAKEVAAQLGLGIKSTETFKARGMKKVGCRTRVDLVRYAAERSWIGG